MTSPTLSDPSMIPGFSQPAVNDILLPATENPNSAIFQQTKPSTEEVCSPQSAVINSESAYLLRTYEAGIGPWMDVFDCSLSYQQGLLTLVPSSPLLLNATCALAARQLSLISSADTWTPVAERYYGTSLGLLRSSLDDPATNPEHAMVATILLSSYELLAFPGQNYHRHFRGAKSLIEALHAHESSQRLTRASFWIYARHEVGEAMNIERSTMQDPKLWPKADLASGATGTGEDVFCNDALRLCGEVVHFLFGSRDKTAGKKWAKEWSGLYLDLNEWMDAIPSALVGREYVDNGVRRYWFSRASFAGAICFYHASQILLFRHCPKASVLAMDLSNDPEELIQHHARQLIDIALSSMPDSVLVTMVQPVFHAARSVTDPVRRREVIDLLEQIQTETGFHTQTKVQVLRSLEVSSS